jgi:hypothetical protein
MSIRKWLYGAPLLAAVFVAGCNSDRIVPSSTGMTSLPGARSAITGAFNTNLYTAGTCSLVNGNQYQSKPDVALNGSPSTLQAGDYFVKVESPSGTLLGLSATATYHVGIGGQCVQLIALVNKASDSSIPGFDNTDNHGGEYKVTISSTADFGAGDIKSDNFKVKDDVIIGVFGDPAVGGSKYYDANLNGQRDIGEVGIGGWPIMVDDGFLPTTLFTFGDGSFGFTGIVGDHYTIAEKVALAPWHQTGNTVNQSTATLTNFVYTFTGSNSVDVQNLNFGNVCTGAGGGLTLGFWSNKNGQALITSADITMLVGLNLVYNTPVTGSQFNPANAAAVKAFLLSGTATNMAYMLSVQLTAMELNVSHSSTSGVTGAAIVYVPTLGFMCITNLMGLANTELGLHTNTVAAGANRTYQETLKTALDLANNAQGYLQAGPATCPSPVFP